MRVRMKPLPDDLKEHLYKIPYMKRSKFNLKAFIPTAAVLFITLSLLYYTYKRTEYVSATTNDITYIGPKDGDIILPSEFSIISKEPFEIYLNSQLLKPKEYGGYYIFEKELMEGEYKVEIIKGKDKKELKFYVVDIS